MRLEEAGVAVAMSVVMWVMVVQEQESRWVGGVDEALARRVWCLSEGITFVIRRVPVSVRCYKLINCTVQYYMYCHGNAAMRLKLVD